VETAQTEIDRAKRRGREAKPFGRPEDPCGKTFQQEKPRAPNG